MRRRKRQEALYRIEEMAALVRSALDIFADPPIPEAEVARELAKLDIDFRFQGETWHMTLALA